MKYSENTLERICSIVPDSRYPMSSDFRLKLLGELIAVKLDSAHRQRELDKALKHVRTQILEEGKRAYLASWERKLTQGWKAVEKTLKGDGEESVRLRQSMPFHNLVTENERLRILLRSYGKSKTELPKFKTKIRLALQRLKPHA